MGYPACACCPFCNNIVIFAMYYGLSSFDRRGIEARILWNASGVLCVSKDRIELGGEVAVFFLLIGSDIVGLRVSSQRVRSDIMRRASEGIGR